VEAWLGWAGFETVRSEEVFWLNQLSYGRKPLPISDYTSASKNHSAHQEDAPAAEWNGGFAPQPA
jgi:hypothetical protein